MSMILQLRMLSDEDDHFLRDYEVPAELSLAGFHDFICDDLRYDKESMVSFFTTDDRWAKLREFTLMDMGAEGLSGENMPARMDKVRLSDVIHSLHDRLIYQFDLLEDRAFFLETVDVKEAEKGKHYPQVLFANGNAPDQFDAAVPTGNRSIFDEAMGDFNEFEGSDAYDDE